MANSNSTTGSCDMDYLDTAELGIVARAWLRRQREWEEMHPPTFAQRVKNASRIWLTDAGWRLHDLLHDLMKSKSWLERIHPK